MSFSPDERERLRKVFLSSPRDGASLDRCIADDAIRARVIHWCEAAVPGYPEQDYLWDLQNQRKANLLGPHATLVLRYGHEGYRHAAEIAARLIEDRHDASVDRLLCDPAIRSSFDSLAAEITPEVELLRLRLAALALRKRGKLQPEVAVRMGDRRQVLQFRAVEVCNDPTRVPGAPGVYVIIDDQLGILYIGEASNLRRRLRGHLDHSTNKGLAKYFWHSGIDCCSIDIHVFPGNDAARSAKWRRSYERELIVSRQPRFNIEFNRTD